MSFPRNLMRELRARGFPASKARVERLMLDLFNREIVGGSLKPRMTADIVTVLLPMARFRKRPAVGLMHHSNRGSQYESPRDLRRL